MPYALAFLIVFGVNLLPALAPPTWAIIVALLFALDLEPWALVPVAAIASTLGRFALAMLARRFRDHLSPKRIEGLERLRGVLLADRKRFLTAVLLFLLSPLPSNQLFLAAGLMGVRLRSLTLAFLAGRMVTYTLYLQGALYVRRSVGDVWRDSLASPGALVLQFVMLAGLAAMLLVDWVRLLDHGKDRRTPPPADETHRIEE